MGDLARRGALRHRRVLRGKTLPDPAGYFRHKAAMHPSVCAFRRIQLPLQGSLFVRCRPRKPPLQGEVSPQATEGCRTWPCKYPSKLLRSPGHHAPRKTWGVNPFRAAALSRLPR